MCFSREIQLFDPVNSHSLIHYVSFSFSLSERDRNFTSMEGTAKVTFLLFVQHAEEIQASGRP